MNLESKQKIVLRAEIVEIIRNTKRLRATLQFIMDISSNTLYTWLRTQDVKMTSKLFLDAVSEYLKIPADDLTEYIDDPKEVHHE